MRTETHGRNPRRFWAACESVRILTRTSTVVAHAYRAQDWTAGRAGTRNDLLKESMSSLDISSEREINNGSIKSGTEKSS
jgi:hypothetical protein